jgi:hypothetical protein
MTGQPPSEPRRTYPSMRYRLAAALHEAANLGDYNLSQRMMTVHGSPSDMSYLDAADMILGTEPMTGLAIEAEAAAQPDEEPEGHEHQGHEYTYRAETCPVCYPEAAAQPAPLTREALVTALRRHQVSMDDARRRYHCDGTCADAILAALPLAVPEPSDTVPWVCWNHRTYNCSTCHPRMAVEALVKLAEDIRNGLPSAVPEATLAAVRRDLLGRIVTWWHTEGTTLDQLEPLIDEAQALLREAYRTPAEQRARPWTTAAMDAEEGQR